MINITSKRKQEINKKQKKAKNKVNNKRDMKRKKAHYIDLPLELQWLLLLTNLKLEVELKSKKNTKEIWRKD